MSQLISHALENVVLLFIYHQNVLKALQTVNSRNNLVLILRKYKFAARDFKNFYYVTFYIYIYI